MAVETFVIHNTQKKCEIIYSNQSMGSKYLHLIKDGRSILSVAQGVRQSHEHPRKKVSPFGLQDLVLEAGEAVCLELFSSFV